MTDTPLTLLTTETDLAVWIGNAFPGDTLEYHRGFLARDTSRINGRLPERQRAELNRIADRVRVAAAEGLVHLLQRRNGADDYSYLAIARQRPRGKKGPRHTAADSTLRMATLGDAA